MIRPVIVVLATAALTACGGEEAPSCQQAITHYYQSGCAYYDLQSGRQYSVGEVVGACRDALQVAPASCTDEVEDWLFCMDSVPDPATSNADCDCSYEQERLLTCG